MRVAIAHDWLNQYGGGEVVLEALHQLFPAAPIYTTLYDPAALPPHFRQWSHSADIRTTFLQRLPHTSTYFRYLMPLYPLAVEDFNLLDYDLVVSSSSFWAKGVVTHAGTTHICYCHAPMRYAWDVYYRFGPTLGPIQRLALALIAHRLRRWDVTAAHRVDSFISNSEFVASKIHKYYGRQAVTIYPPVDTDYFYSDAEPGDYYVAVSRLRPYKRLDVAVEAFNRLRLPLKIIGTGSELKRLRQLAGPTVDVLGWQSRTDLRAFLTGSRGFISTACEDFGIAAVEAMAAGRPVVALRAGGARETVQEPTTGIFFDNQTPDAVIHAVERLERLGPYDPRAIRTHARQFDRAIFLERLQGHIDSCLAGAGDRATGTAVGRRTELCAS